MAPRTLTQSQYHLCRILWRDGPMDELQLLTRCQEELGWRRTAARRLRPSCLPGLPGVDLAARA